MKRLMIIGLWPDDVVKYCTEKCDCRRYAFDRIIYHRGGRAARERICIPVVDRSGAVTTYLDLPVTLLEAGVVYLRLDDGSDIFLSDTQMVLIANEVERRRAELAGTGLKTLGKWFESGLPTAEDYLEPGDEVDAVMADDQKEAEFLGHEAGRVKHQECDEIEVVGVMPVISARNAGKGRLCQRIPLKERALKFVKEAIKNGRKKAH